MTTHATIASDAIIFLPGIKGTTLVNTNRADYDTIWSAIQSQYEDLNLLELSFDEHQVGYDSWPHSLIKPGQIEGIVYSEFLRDIKTEKPIYLFNYDWRQNSEVNAKRLQDFMTMLKQKSLASKRFKSPLKRFDLIAHSHGANVLRQLTAIEGFRRIGRIVLAAPPLRGSLDSVDAVLTGEGVFPGVRARVRKLIRTFPGALELLLTYGAAHFEDDSDVDFFNANHWQKNLLDKNNSHAEIFQQTLIIAKRVQAQLHDWSGLRKELRDRILIIARDGYETAQSVRVHRHLAGEPENYVDLEHTHFSSHGDGTVPHVSSCAWSKKILTLMATDSWRYRDYGHGFILKDERIQKMVRRFLSRSQVFDWSIPGHSIKRVTDVTTSSNEHDNPDWSVILE